MGKIHSYFSYPSNYEYILRIIEIAAPFLAASYTAFYSLGEKKYTKSLKEFMAIGIVPLSFLAAIRHFFFFGKARYFELDGVGANLGFGVAGIVALCNNSSNETLGAIFVASTVYMIINTISWILYRKNSSEKYFMVGSSLVITGLTIYFTYIAYHEKTDPNEDF